MTDQHWAKLHENYSEKDWALMPSLFAQTVKDYLPKNGRLLELGAGIGQDSTYFSSLGYEVIATDLRVDQLRKNSEGKFSVKALDLRQLLPFQDASFDVVYAHLSLHYFDEQTTRTIFSEIYRILKPAGILAFFTNSTDDPQYGTGQQIEPDYFETAGTTKRFFNVSTAKQFAHEFIPLLTDNNGETYKDSAMGVHNLIRFIGTKST